MNHFTGMAVNIVSCLWLIFAIVFFSFPYEMPVSGMCIILPWSSRFVISSAWPLANLFLTASNMNYTCVVVGGFLLIELGWWIIAGKKYSQTVQRAREEEHNAAMVEGERGEKT